MSDDAPGASGGGGTDAPSADDAAAGGDSTLAHVDGPIILFDGVCNLCNTAIRFIVRFDAAGHFQFAPLQSDVGQALLERHGLATDALDSVVLIEDGAYATKSTAAIRVARQLDGPLPLLYPLIYLPERVRDWAYDLVADYRYRLFGHKDECPVPEPEIRERFADRRID